MICCCLKSAIVVIEITRMVSVHTKNVHNNKRYKNPDTI